MKCSKCGSEIPKKQTVCPDCHYIMGSDNGYSWSGHSEKVNPNEK